MNTYSSTEIVSLLTNEGFDITKRTFAYYASDKKILPKPIIHNGKATYTDYHIKYLKSLLILKEKGNTLKEIKEELDKLDELQLELISSTYKPFTSKEMIEDIQEAYSSLSAINSINECSIQNDNITAHARGYSQSMFQSNAISSSMMNSAQSKSLNQYHAGDSLGLSRSVTTAKSSVTNSEPNEKKSKRTMINENVILETKNISTEKLQKMIEEIDKIYNEDI